MLASWSSVRRRLFIAYCLKILFELTQFSSAEMFFRVHSPLIHGQGSAVYGFRATRRALNSVTEIALDG